MAENVMKRICVFCGSSQGVRPAYAEAARETAAALVERGLGLVYGGGNVGLMKVVADAVLDAGGHVIGVIPHALERREVAHPGLPDLRIVASMHERKATMAELSDGFVSLPGGLGTFEECLEILTWAQLGMHAKPIGLLNVDGYWSGLLDFLRRGVDEGFVPESSLGMLHVAERPEKLLEAFARHEPPRVERWIEPDES
jgi:uncharacterized protein (TIGR00730 family)